MGLDRIPNGDPVIERCVDGLFNGTELAEGNGLHDVARCLDE